MTYITVTTQTDADGERRDYWTAHDTLRTARNAFEAAKTDGVYSASLCAVLDSTDYADDSFIDLTGHAGLLYLCDWNNGEFTEIHTPATLRAKYGETNLFDGHTSEWRAIVHPFTLGSFAEVLAYMDEEPPDGVIFRCENMTIQRIR
jgi:hypothetical protein